MVNVVQLKGPYSGLADRFHSQLRDGHLSFSSRRPRDVTERAQMNSYATLHQPRSIVKETEVFRP